MKHDNKHLKNHKITDTFDSCTVCDCENFLLSHYI